MTDEIEKYEEVEVLPVGVVEAQSRAEIDIQISTAKKFPRNQVRAKEKAISVVSKKEVAETCIYSLPRGGSNITGPSVHLANIIASLYGNLRVDSKIVEIGDTMLTAQSICMDLESNYAKRTEVKRRITTKRGEKFTDDMIVVTANAALSIASRNAIMQVVPRSFTDDIFNAAQKVIVGDLSTKEKLIARRTEVLQNFKDNYNVTEEEIVNALGVSGVNNINESKLTDLIGLAQAIRDGDTTVAEIFGRNTDKSAAETKQKVEEFIKKAKESKGELPLK